MMRSWGWLVLCWLASWSAFASAILASEVAAPSQAVRSQQQFGWELYQRLAQKPQGNLCFSPSNVQLALAMTYAGARGETARQMAGVLHFELPADELHAEFSRLREDQIVSDDRSGLQLSAANRLWGQRGFQFSPGFIKLTNKYYGAELGQVDFERQPEDARKTINTWVGQQTHDKIPSLLPAAVIGSSTRLVLSSAQYFLGEWVYPFDDKAIVKAPFHRAAGGDFETSYMTQSQRLRFAENGGIQLLELPYRGKRFSMLVLLPEKVDGLKAMEDSLRPNVIDGMIAKLRPRPVKVYLPRFKAKAKFELADTLAAMGMSLAFTPSADFSGITTTEKLFLSAVIHEAYVDVNAKGTEAAAATAVVADRGLPPAEERVPVVFRADHPFVYVIRDERNGSPLFMGRLTDPTP